MRNIFKGEQNDLSLNNFRAFKVMFYEDHPGLFDITINAEYAVINNKNILSQKCLLLLNPNCSTPFEDACMFALREYKGEPWLSLQCFNINKNLKEYVDKILSLNGIKEEALEQIKFL